ncbi:MAG: OPT family oligopeptide transporter [Planctomycetota bacterium]|nr:MAG: OPT family oligopeptide transporter [Planctomycetota bacterium]
MGLFQKAPTTPEELEQCHPLQIPPDEVLEFDEKTWYQRAYRGEHVPQLTVRALIMGSILGFFLAFTNLYVGLKTGWHLGVAITACILSYSIWSGLQNLGLAKSPMTILENNCMQSTASAAGYSTGGTMVSAIPALLMLTVTLENPGGTHIELWVLAAWTFLLAMLGVFLAIPMKRNMINQERLKFPSGTAAAVTLQSLYSEGKEAGRKAKALFLAGIVGLATPLVKDLSFLKKVAEDGTAQMHALIPGYSKIFDWLPPIHANGKSYAPSDFTMKMENGFLMVAAGALVGLRIAIYMAIGGVLLVFWVGPMALEAEWTNPAGDLVTAATHPGKAWKEIGVWIGAPIMVSSGLLSFLLQWKTIARAFTGFGKGGGKEDELVAKTEVPSSWFFTGAGFAGLLVVFLAYQYFEVPLHMGALAVVLTFMLALVACRATGESDITPTGAMGKIMQLSYGVLVPKNATANLMTAGITAGAAGASADLLNDLKSGYLLGANPRRQFVAQFLGIFTGTLATVIGFRILIPDASVLMGEDPAFPAPAAAQWKAVADVFVIGFENLHPMARQGIFYGLIAGAVMVLAEKILPKYRKWLPSATGMGLGFILPFQYPWAMFLGALAAYLFHKANEEQAHRYVVPLASGIIAGESIMGVIVAGLNSSVFAG